MSIVVVNVRQERPANMVYVGRTCSELAGSVLGNPFKRQAGQAPGSTLNDYRDWLRKEWKRGGAVRQELERLADLAAATGDDDLALGCWCKPAPCHGDVIREAVEGILRQRGRG